jgi:long-subunit acyl-CoA synthetase (AMP-forming)
MCSLPKPSGFVADLRARPMFISVPRLWAKFQHGVLAKMPARKLDFLLSLPIIGNIVRKKVLTGLGLNHVRLAGSGSAPIPPELIAWYHKLGLNLLEGYAMSEDFAYSHLSKENMHKPGYVGVPFPGVEVRISEEHEVLIKSPGQMVGYYKRPDLNAEAFTADGFFRTGDLGERDPSGLLKLTGRLKELFQDRQGKYVAPAPIENLINAHPVVEMSLVSGVGHPAAFAMVVLSEDLRPKVGDPTVRAEVEAQLKEVLADVNRRVAEYEQLRMLVVVSDPWSIENGLLTPTMKIKRKIDRRSPPRSSSGTPPGSGHLGLNAARRVPAQGWRARACHPAVCFSSDLTRASTSTGRRVVDHAAVQTALAVIEHRVRSGPITGSCGAISAICGVAS